MKHWWRQGKCIIMKFGTRYGEAQVVISCPDHAVTKADLEQIAAKLRKSYVSRKGIRLMEFRRAILKTHDEKPIV